MNFSIFSKAVHDKLQSFNGRKLFKSSVPCSVPGRDEPCIPDQHRARLLLLQELQHEILLSLGGVSTVTLWIYWNNGEEALSRGARQCRLEWLDRIIKRCKVRELIDEIREAFPHFEWKQNGDFLIVRTESWILSVDVSAPKRGYPAILAEINQNLQLPPAASFKSCAIAAVKDVLQQTQQNIKFRMDQLNRMSEELERNLHEFAKEKS